VIYVLPGTDQQFINFKHAFGPDFRIVMHKQDLIEGSADGRVLVLLIGTWYDHPLRDEVLNYCASKDDQGRPRGQAFAMFGSRSK
jgi:hypothetical protein